MTYYTIIVPLRFKDINLLSIRDPLKFEVWICFLISIPGYILAMAFMNYLYSGRPNWEATASSIIRSALSERKSSNVKPPRHMYQKLMTLMWGLMMVVLISAYKANLLAMITRPSLNEPFMNAEGMVGQTGIKWQLKETGLFHSYAKELDPERVLRKVYDKGTIMPSANYTKHCKEGLQQGIASIVDISTAMQILADNFSEKGTCNYFLTEDKILAADSALAFQVMKGMLKNIIGVPKYCIIRNKAPSWKI